MVAAVGEHFSESQLASAQVVLTTCNRESVEFDEFDHETLKTATVIVIDSAVHSGQTMLRVIEELRNLGAKEIISYSLVVKRNSSFIPNYFGVLIGDRDRAYFQLTAIPNNRLQQKRPFGVLRALEEKDGARQMFDSGVESLDRIHLSDLLYEQETRNSKIYLYEHGSEICGLLIFEKKTRTLFIDTIANAQSYRGVGLGGTLMRWAETWQDTVIATL